MSRRHFLRQLTTGLAVVSSGLVCRRALAQSTAAPVGARAGWARLITPSPFWSMHAEQDATVVDFLRREADVLLDATPYAVDPGNLDQLGAFPFIFTNGLTSIEDPRALDNLKEYLQRGGFFLIEGCLDHRVTRSFTNFLASHVALYEKFFTGITARRFIPGHPIFHARFQIDESKLALIEPTADDRRWENAPQAIYGIYQQNRLLSLVSLDHLYCEWFTKADKVPFCLRQIANIYVYVMTR